MEKSDKKRILTRVLIVIAALTLLSCCFLGSTFARYVTDASGTAQIGVAKWDVSVTPTSGTTVSAALGADLSPDKEAWTSGSSTKRQNSTKKALVAAISNSGEVDALVSLTGSTTPTLTSAEGLSDETKKGNIAYSDFNTGLAAACFSVKFYMSKNSREPANATTEFKNLTNYELDAGSAIYIFAQVTWTSQDTAEASGDDLDTWIGQYITSVSWTLTYTAVQGEEFPTT